MLASERERAHNIYLVFKSLNEPDREMKEWSLTLFAII